MDNFSEQAKLEDTRMELFSLMKNKNAGGDNIKSSKHLLSNESSHINFSSIMKEKIFCSNTKKKNISLIF